MRQEIAKIGLFLQTRYADFQLVIFVFLGYIVLTISR